MLRQQGQNMRRNELEPFDNEDGPSQQLLDDSRSVFARGSEHGPRSPTMNTSKQVERDHPSPHIRDRASYLDKSGEDSTAILARVTRKSRGRPSKKLKKPTVVSTRPDIQKSRKDIFDVSDDPEDEQEKTAGYETTQASNLLSGCQTEIQKDTTLTQTHNTRRRLKKIPKFVHYVISPQQGPVQWDSDTEGVLFDLLNKGTGYLEIQEKLQYFSLQDIKQRAANLQAQPEESNGQNMLDVPARTSASLPSRKRKALHGDATEQQGTSALAARDLQDGKVSRKRPKVMKRPKGDKKVQANIPIEQNVSDFLPHESLQQLDEEMATHSPGKDVEEAGLSNNDNEGHDGREVVQIGISEDDDIISDIYIPGLHKRYLGKITAIRYIFRRARRYEHKYSRAETSSRILAIQAIQQRKELIKRHFERLNSTNDVRTTSALIDHALGELKSDVLHLDPGTIEHAPRCSSGSSKAEERSAESASNSRDYVFQVYSLVFPALFAVLGAAFRYHDQRADRDAELTRWELLSWIRILAIMTALHPKVRKWTPKVDLGDFSIGDYQRTVLWPLQALLYDFQRMSIVWRTLQSQADSASHAVATFQDGIQFRRLRIIAKQIDEETMQIAGRLNYIHRRRVQAEADPARRTVLELSLPDISSRYKSKQRRIQGIDNFSDQNLAEPDIEEDANGTPFIREPVFRPRSSYTPPPHRTQDKEFDDWTRDEMQTLAVALRRYAVRLPMHTLHSGEQFWRPLFESCCGLRGYTVYGTLRDKSTGAIMRAIAVFQKATMDGVDSDEAPIWIRDIPDLDLCELLL